MFHLNGYSKIFCWFSKVGITINKKNSFQCKKKKKKSCSSTDQQIPLKLNAGHPLQFCQVGKTKIINAIAHREKSKDFNFKCWHWGF